MVNIIVFAIELHNQYLKILASHTLKCYWFECDYLALSFVDLKQHLIYHGYHEKLKAIGRNVEERAKLPECTQSEKFSIPVAPNGYDCEWEYCHQKFETVYEFFQHIKFHIYHNPKGAKEGVINCCWKGCTNRVAFKTQYKLAEHLRMHTKEKVLACSTCGNLFASRTKLCDHRKRQLPPDCK